MDNQEIIPNLNIDRSYPHPNPSISFWLQGTRSSPLLGFRSENFPESAEVVIIGSGLSGASTAYFLLTGENTPQNVVMLEAREVCSGATGRNGGHCRPDCYRGYSGYKTTFGKEQAFKILQNEMDTLNLTEEIIKKERIECDFWRGDYFIDVAMNQSCADQWSETLAEYTADGADLEGIVEWIDDPGEAKKLSRCAHAHAVARFSAGSLWPFKLASGLLDICIKKHNLNLQSTTPVLAVRRPPNSEYGSWIVETERGNIIANKVVFASNAFTATLLPEFKDKITPFRGQCSAIIPTKPFSGPGLLKHTYSFRWGAPRGDYDYMIQRPKDGTIILGGGRSQVALDDQIDQTDDSVKNPAITEYLRVVLRDYLEGWGEESIGEGLFSDWTGVMGYTPEAVPYVGPVHGKSGLFINAGHSGHGMARIMTCSRGIAALMKGANWEATGLPECFEPTPSRLSSSKTVKELWMERYAQGGQMLH
ncbi:hypothetical protein Clacol_001193 [Clathrus columnatus]|uniref:FAD dependent oxidoreductase domain-containing protein n=1 Tax=Clathrus columnatus TaxID=1419009 RepID=A0AAV5A1V8_9AGAM|nr:hypothetical protein Clacol_001193 [Clathrus columnatus]